MSSKPEKLTINAKNKASKMEEPDKEEPAKPPYKSVWKGFEDEGMENLYKTFSAHKKKHGLRCVLFASILFNLYIIGMPEGYWIVSIIFGGVMLTINMILFFCMTRIGLDKEVWSGRVAHLSWFVSALQLSLHTITRDASPHEGLSWAIVFVYFSATALPLSVQFSTAYSVICAAMYLASVFIVSAPTEYLAIEMIGNTLLLSTAAAVGLMVYHESDRHQRRAFLDTIKALEMKMVIEEQSREQERLLLSVLPEHVAGRMRQDLGAIDKQFKKIYMSRHENVSILYADIVGFTAISSTYSAQDLVAILNELFARFDRLAEKYQQLRIKILGDCYYCISGAPVERPDHAILCVHMGLSMVKAIKYVQQTTNSPVDMRVGIHTGAVLAGVLGQKQWQFDVYSRDVELANKMESSGMAGRVHISEVTLSFLDDSFEVEPAYGEKREEALRLAGLKTFFISKVLKPFQPDEKDKPNAGNTACEDGASDFRDDGELRTPQEEKSFDKEDCEASVDFGDRLRDELINEDKKLNTERDKKRSWILDRGRSSESNGDGAGAGAPLLVWSAGASVWLFVSWLFTRSLLATESWYLSQPSILTLLASLALAAVLAAAVYVLDRCMALTSKIKWAPSLSAILSALLVVVISAGNVYRISHTYMHVSVEASSYLCGYEAGGGAAGVGGSVRLQHVSAGALCGLGASLCAARRWSSEPRALLATALALAHVTAPLLVCGNATTDNAHGKWHTLKFIEPYTTACSLALIAAAISYFTDFWESSERWMAERASRTRHQRERAEDVRRRNEALVCNVLPAHVAAHFMGARRRRHADLYSQSYAEVGVLFASMPNFSDFYSEETVNNQGLECLRFLNEVISDFDALLEKPRYQDIIKIKTIGSTYMAASGIHTSSSVKSEESEHHRWSHLALLVEFALELKRALQSINEQSFNHFVLKMGVNHGPVTAGVIGARKPHYDIWGNTVNVASRMESTGKAGCIQVTEETSQILREFGYTFEQRGLVAVKGKGQLMTYYLQGQGRPEEGGKERKQNKMETLEEEDSCSERSQSELVRDPRDPRDPREPYSPRPDEASALLSSAAAAAAPVVSTVTLVSETEPLVANGMMFSDVM